MSGRGDDQPQMNLPEIQRLLQRNPWLSLPFLPRVEQDNSKLPGKKGDPAHKETNISSAEFISLSLLSLPKNQYEGEIVLLLYREAN